MMICIDQPIAGMIEPVIEIHDKVISISMKFDFVLPEPAWKAEAAQALKEMAGE
jgi:hypothetical protein